MSGLKVFQNREHAGRLLAERMKGRAFCDSIVIALPRGGVPVGYEVAHKLNLPLEVLVVRKIGHPLQPEFGIGAVTENGFSWIDEDAAQRTGATKSEIKKVLEVESHEAVRRVWKYRGVREFPSLKDKIAILVDDGLATGVTARVACQYIKEHLSAKKVVLAVPVCPAKTFNLLQSLVDEIICLEMPDNFYSVGQFYSDFDQVTDEEVSSLLSLSSGVIGSEVSIKDGKIRLSGILTIPQNPLGIVLFAHGSGSGRLSPRNQQVARTLNRSKLATLLFDLLTPEESEVNANVFDISLLARRLILATHWVQKRDNIKGLPIGYFGASTGAGAALWAAAELGEEILAVVSRGGRPDLAIPRLEDVTAPTLLIVGGNDGPVIEINREALKYLQLGELTIVPGASHLFEEPGTLESVSKLAASWFLRHLSLGGFYDTAESA